MAIKRYLKPGKEESSLKRFHPWFSGAIARFDGEPEEGGSCRSIHFEEGIYNNDISRSEVVSRTCALFRQNPSTTISGNATGNCLWYALWNRYRSQSHNTPTVLYTVRETICLGWSLTLCPDCRHASAFPVECSRYDCSPKPCSEVMVIQDRKYSL